MTFADHLLNVITAELATARSSPPPVAPVTFATKPAPMSGGFWASLYSFELANAPDGWRGGLVLRVMPNADAAAKEIIVQTALARQGYNTPMVTMSGDDQTLGGAFMIMHRAEGRSPLGGLKIGRDLLGLRRTLAELPKLLARVAVDLHTVDPEPVAGALRAAGIVLPPLGDAHYRGLVIAAGAETAAVGFDRLDAWFSANQPSVDKPVVCHGDLHPFNILVAADGTVTVLDWTNANLCPAEFDVGFTTAFLRCAPIGVPSFVRPVTQRLMSRLAARFVAAYSVRRPVRREVMRWYEALQYARCLAEVAIARENPGGNIGSAHPFELSARDMTRELAAITGVTVVLPPRADGSPR